MLYTAKSLSDIAAEFARHADVARNAAMIQTTIKEARFQEGKAAAYRHAAEQLRQTELVSKES